MRTTIHLTLALLVFAAGCGPDEEISAGSGDLLKSSVARETSPLVTDAELAKQISGNNAFALAMYARTRSTPGNLIFSPHSISTALAMLVAGARGATESEINAAMHFKLPPTTLHAAFNALDLQLASRGKGVAKSGKFRLRPINASWGQNGFGYLLPYLDTLARHYGAGLRLLNFQQAPEAARGVINGWVSQNSNKRIKELLPEGSITEEIRLVLTNVITFGAAWAKPFKQARTFKETFDLASGAKVKVSYMRHEIPTSFAYMSGNGFEAVQLDYLGNELSMLLLVPDAGKLPSLEQGLTVAWLQGVMSKLKSRCMHLIVPRFSFKYRLPLKENLMALGVKLAFDPDHADLSAITGGRHLHVSDAFHTAFIAVDEEGTEAAAATAVLGFYGITMSPVMYVDRPFLFLIRDHATGAILFMGRVSDPR